MDKEDKGLVIVGVRGVKITITALIGGYFVGKVFSAYMGSIPLEITRPGNSIGPLLLLINNFRV